MEDLTSAQYIFMVIGLIVVLVGGVYAYSKYRSKPGSGSGKGPGKKIPNPK